MIPPPFPQQPLPHIADAFREYIRNDIPARLIDTSSLKFVERDAVYDVFLSDIAKITEEDVENRMRTVGVDRTHPEAGNYELLAPRRIKFYDKEWRPFTTLANDKDDPALMSALSTVTGIPRDVVVADNSRGIKGRGIWEIMSWASTRKTTRVEDAAYCLYGLFDVNLPITYGEGEKAFPRLVEAIMVRCPTWDVFAWAGQASEGHPALPCSPACYPKWDEAMVGGEVGMTAFVLTPHGLRLTSVPLIPMVFMSEARDGNGSFVVTLRPRSSVAAALGVYSDVTVICGSGRLQHIRDAVDLHACILNYKPSRGNQRGKVQVGRTYVCFLLHMEGRNAEGATWLKVGTDNVLRIACRGVPAQSTSPRRTHSEVEDDVFDLPLETTYIRVPRAQSTLWV
ncbi:hypothetical protein J3R83DRAFT_2596 [Lanmaoa asiatica]|nr:hypothetical protein J3R83DRAFT_2596 [Lanmaoa asiatica]